MTDNDPRDIEDQNEIKANPDTIRQRLDATSVAKETYTFFEAQEAVFEFEKLLKSKGITITNGSDLERICLNVIDVLEKHRYPALQDPLADIRPYLSEIMGLHDIIRKILRIKDHPQFDSLIPHLKILNEASVPQNTKSPITDDGSNKIFELLIATLAMSISSEVFVESPTNSSTKLADKRNPDVMFVANGRKWGIACKVLHTHSANTFFDSAQKGVDQIEKSSADIGIVAFNMKNLLDYELLWPILNEDEARQGSEPLFGVFTDLSFPLEVIKQIARRKDEELIEAVSLQWYQDLFAGKRSVHGILLFLQTGTSVLLMGKPTATTLGIFYLVNRFNINLADYPEFAELNRVMHNL